MGYVPVTCLVSGLVDFLTLRGNWQLKAHGGAATQAGDDANLTLMGFDDAPDNRQAETGAFDFRACQDRFKGTFLLFFAHAFAGVFEVEEYKMSFAAIL